MKEEYDAVVVGAGPAGSLIARTLAKEGIDVIMIEKRQEIGTPVRCGEGFGLPGIKKMGLDPNPRWAVQEIHGAVLVAPNKKRLVMMSKDQGYVIERKEFDKELVKLAARAGADVRVKTRATSVLKEDGVVKGVTAEFMGDEYELRAKLTIGADGVESRVARWAGIDTTNKLGEINTCVQYEMIGVELEPPDLLEFYLGNKVAPGGYVWVFPKGDDCANVGVGVRATQNETAFQYLNNFINSHKNFKDAAVIEFNAGAVPVGGILDSMVASGLMLVGDAAHNVNPIHGGGIEIAGVSAIIAGKVGANAIKEGDISAKRLSEYDKLWHKEFGKMLKLVKLRRFVERLSDEELNKLAEILAPEDITALTKGDFMKSAKIIIKKAPKLAGLAREIIF